MLNPDFVSKFSSVIQSLGEFKANVDGNLDVLYERRDTLMTLAEFYNELGDFDELSTDSEKDQMFDELWAKYSTNPPACTFACGFAPSTEEGNNVGTATGVTLKMSCFTNSADDEVIALQRQVKTGTIIIASVKRSITDSFRTINDPSYPYIPIGDKKYSFTDVCKAMSEQITLSEVTSVAIEQYNNGTLSAANLNTALVGTTGYGSEYFNSLIATLGGAVSSGSSPILLLNTLKTLFSAYGSVSAVDDDNFTFAVDTYTVGTSFFIGIDTIINVASIVIGLVVSYFNPLLGAMVTVVGGVVADITEQITENTADYCIFPDNPTFTGFGQNVSRGYANSSSNVLISEAAQKGLAISCSMSPTLTALAYDAPIQNSQHINLYPTQEFIVPILPTTAEGWSYLANMYANGNRVISDRFELEGQPRSCHWIMQLSNSAGVTSSVEQRAQDFAAYNQYLADNPDKCWMPNGLEDGVGVREGCLKLALFMNYLGLVYSRYSLSDEYAALGEFDIDVQLLSNYLDTNWYGSMSQILTANKLVYFCAVAKFIYNYLTVRPYSEDLGISFAQHLQNGLQTEELRNFYIGMDWAEMVNTFLLTNLNSGYGFLGEWFLNYSDHSIRTNLIQTSSLAPTDTMNPSIIPPAQNVNIWVRIALTVGVIAAVVTVTLLVRSKLKKKAIVKFSKYASTASVSYQRYIETGDKKDYKAWKRNQMKGNFIGGLFGLGSIDAVNNWVNSPANSAVVATAGSASEFLSRTEEIIRLISG